MRLLEDRRRTDLRAGRSGRADRRGAAAQGDRGRRGEARRALLGELQGIPRGTGTGGSRCRLSQRTGGTRCARSLGRSGLTTIRPAASPRFGAFDPKHRMERPSGGWSPSTRLRRSTMIVRFSAGRGRSGHGDRPSLPPAAERAQAGSARRMAEAGVSEARLLRLLRLPRSELPEELRRLARLMGAKGDAGRFDWSDAFDAAVLGRRTASACAATSPATTTAGSTISRSSRRARHEHAEIRSDPHPAFLSGHAAQSRRRRPRQAPALRRRRAPADLVAVPEAALAHGGRWPCARAIDPEHRRLDPLAADLEGDDPRSAGGRGVAVRRP